MKEDRNCQWFEEDMTRKGHNHSLRPNKKISVFLVTGRGLRFFGRVWSLVWAFFILIIKKNICILKGISSFKMHKITFFEKKSRFSPVN